MTLPRGIPSPSRHSNLLFSRVADWPSKGVDVEAEVEMARQLRKQIRLGPQAAPPSVAMYTFFHTHDGMNCVDFNHQQDKLAAGFSESYIRIYNLSSDRRPHHNPSEEIDSTTIQSPR